MIRVILSGAALLLGAAALPVAALAQGATASSPVDLAAQAALLKPGQWVWAPQIAPAGPVLVYVDLSDQTATIYRNGVRIAVTTVSTGKPGHETPTGVFTILQKDPNHHSSKYNDAPMPFQERLTWDGVALHAGGLPGFPESHGCVHLPLEFSKLLFTITSLGGTVIIAGDAGRPVMSPNLGLLGPTDTGLTQPLTAGEAYSWDPALAPTGPLTIVISGSDQRAIVLRNGVEIGRSRVRVPGGGFATHVMTYAGLAGGNPRWIYVDVPGHAGESGKPADMSILSSTDMPAGFVSALKSAIVPGSTILLTEAPVEPQSTGKALTLLASNP
ncbi:MAG: L,D-transpeptidase family protein [Sphingomicrobium sp.]